MKFRKSVAAVLAAAVLGAVPASAMATTWWGPGGMYPGGGIELSNGAVYTYSTIYHPHTDYKFHVRLRHNTGNIDHAYGYYSSLTAVKTESTISWPGCYRTSTAAGGGVGYASGITCAY